MTPETKQLATALGTACVRNVCPKVLRLMASREAQIISSELVEGGLQVLKLLVNEAATCTIGTPGSVGALNSDGRASAGFLQHNVDGVHCSLQNYTDCDANADSLAHVIQQCKCTITGCVRHYCSELKIETGTSQSASPSAAGDRALRTF